MKKHLQKPEGLSLKLSMLALFMVLCSLTGQLYGQRGNSITLSVDNERLEKVFDLISRQSGYNFVYGNDNIANTGLVTLKLRNATIEETMEAVLKGSGLWYRIEGQDIIIVSPKFEEPQQKAKTSRTIEGRVTDSQNTPLAGVAVIIKGTNKGVITEADGSYSLPIPSDGAIVSFTYLGMEPRDIMVTTQKDLNVKMQYSASNIDNVVVTAYGTVQKKEDMVGSAHQVNAEQLKTLPVTRVDRMLEGLVPGFEISPQANYAEGRNRYSVRVRGESSLNAGGEPLWIIDGVRMYTGNNKNTMTGTEYNVSPLSLLDPNDIESVTVLKDATQTSIYGADGANGVVLITTKRGAKGKPTVSAAVKYGLGVIDNSTKFKTVDGPTYLSLAKEAWQNAGKDMRAFPWLDNYMNTYSATATDWYDYYFGVGKTLNANISVRGGGESMSNYLSVGYYDEQPMVLGNRTQRISARFNSDADITRKLKLSLRMGVSHTTNLIFTAGNVYSILPIFSPYYEESSEYRLMNVKTEMVKKGAYDPYGTNGERVQNDNEVFFPYQYRFANTLAERDENDVRNRTFKATGNVNLSYEIIKGLSLSAEFGIDYMGSYDNIYKARTNLSGGKWTRVSAEIDPTQPLQYVPEGSSQRNQANNLVWNNTEKLAFARSFGKHRVNALAALELYHAEQQIIKTSGRGFPNDKMQEVSYSQENTRIMYSNSDINRRLSYFGQLSYSFDSRYYFTANYRRDGSSMFGEYQRWAQFYSFGASWNIHNEHFFDVPWLNTLKLKGSFGSVGNSRMQDFLSEGSINISGSNGYRDNISGTMGDAPNPGLSWETVYKTNLGLDIGVLDDALYVGIEVYNHNTVDMISELPVSSLTGARNIARNSGSMRNRGIEVSITSRNIRTPDFMWKTMFTLSHNKNKIMSLYAEASKSMTQYGWYEGYEKGVWTLIRWAGVDPRDGSPLFYDTEGNITRTYDYNNRVPLYDMSRYPTVSGAMTNTFVWKNLELYIQINYSIGGWMRSSAFSSTMDDGRNLNSLTNATNVPVEILDRWQRPGQLAATPVLIDELSRNTMLNNTRNMFNMTNIRLSNVSLTYNLPSRFCEKLRLSRASVSFTADNLYFFSPYQSANRNSYKTVYSAYPLERIFSLGIDLNF